MSIEHPDDFSSAPIGAGEPYAAPAESWLQRWTRVVHAAPTWSGVDYPPADCAGAQHARAEHAATQPKVLVVPEGCTLIVHGTGEALDAYDVVHVHGRLEIPEYNGRLMRTRVTLHGKAQVERQG